MADEPASGTARRRGSRPVESSPESAHRAALDLLARRTHFESELERKLLDRGFLPEHVADALERLRRARLVDDRSAAVELVTARLRRAPQGRRRLEAELRRRRLDPETVEAALAAAFPEDEGELVRAAVERFRRRRGGDDPRALGRHLDRLGFSTRDILAVADELPGTGPPDD